MATCCAKLAPGDEVLTARQRLRHVKPIDVAAEHERARRCAAAAIAGRRRSLGGMTVLRVIVALPYVRTSA